MQRLQHADPVPHPAGWRRMPLICPKRAGDYLPGPLPGFQGKSAAAPAEAFPVRMTAE